MNNNIIMKRLKGINLFVMHDKSLQTSPALCNTMDYSPPGSSVHGILQARILEWVVISSSRGSSQSKDGNCISYVSCIGGGFFWSGRYSKSTVHKDFYAKSYVSTY